MSIYMKSFAVFVICASSVAMVAAAPPVEMSDEAGNIYLNQDMPKAADLPASIIDSPLANNSANYHSSDYDATALSCMGQVDATTYSPSSMSLLDSKDVAGETAQLSAESRVMSTRARLERRMRETYDNRAGKF